MSNSVLTFNYHIQLNSDNSIPAKEIRRLARWSCIGNQDTFAHVAQVKCNTQDNYEVQFEHGSLSILPLSQMIQQWFDRYPQQPLFSMHLFQRIARELITAIAHVHERALVHGALQSAMLCVTPLNGSLFIRGQDTVLFEPFIRVSTMSQANEYFYNRYTAPEILKQQQQQQQSDAAAPEQLNTVYTTAADVWSLGVILFEMLFGEPMYSAPTNSPPSILLAIFRFIQQMNDLQKHNSSSQTKTCTKLGLLRLLDQRKPGASTIDMIWPSQALFEALDVIAQTVQFQPEKRITLQALLQHPFFVDSSPVPTRPESNDEGISDTRVATLSWLSNPLRSQILCKLHGIPAAACNIWYDHTVRLLDRVVIQWNVEQLRGKQLRFRTQNHRVYYCLTAVVVWIVHDIRHADDSDWTTQNAIDCFMNLIASDENAVQLQCPDTAEICTWQKSAVTLCNGQLYL